ncbi:MAG: PorT family protein [Ferruginibacter sp.]|nr:PorT family protein [Cytophagales bacterium]
MRQYLSGFFLCLAVSLAAAQEREATRRPFDFGLKGGLNISSLGGNDSQIGSAKAGFHAGAYLITFLSERVSLQPELVYSQQGFQLTGQFPARFNHNYLNLPILFRIEVGPGATVQLGPQVGYFLNRDDFGGYKQIDFGLALGVGYALENGLNLTARYNLGFANVTESISNQVPSRTNRVFQLSLGYTFHKMD